MRAAWLLTVTGCIGLAEGGYTNTLAPHGGGGGGLVLRAAPNTLDEGDHFLLDVALRGDVATSGSRGGVGTSLAYVPWAGYVHASSPFARAELWIAPLQGGAASNDALVLPAAELGWLWFPHDLPDEGLYSFGVRAEWLDRSGAAAGSLGWFIYVGIGSRSRLGIPD